jgi:hypothetical protein
MPNPRGMFPPQFSKNGCGPSLTLADVTAAWYAADDADKGAFINALSDDPWGGYLVGNIFTNALNNSDTEELQDVIKAIESLHWFYSPQTPPPVQTPVIDLPMVQSAFDTADDTSQNNFVLDLLNNFRTNLVFSQLSAPQIWAAIVAALKACGATFSSRVQFVFGPGVNSLGIEYDAPCTFVLVGTVYLGNPPGGSENMQFLQQIIPYEECNGPVRQPLQDLVVSVPWDGVTNPGLGALFSMFMQKLDQLLRCCPPCQYDGPFKQDTIVGFGQVNFPSNPLFLIDWIQFAVEAVGDPKVVEFGQPNLARYGKFAWIDNGTIRPLQWINFDGQAHYAPSALCTGFVYILDPGVSLTYHAIGRDGGEQHFGVQ